jgi:bifunctional ADP-heptose synthase (sugar kinase/adenylyltransferase)
MNSSTNKPKEKFSFNEAKEIIDKIGELKILIIGDTIIDEYIYVSLLGKPSKENITSTIYEDIERKAGGLLTAVNILSSFCNNIDYITVMSDKKNDEVLISEYTAKNLNQQITIKRPYPTTKKTRFVLRGERPKKLFEIYEMNDEFIDEKIERKILDYLNSEITEYDLVIVQDYGHGLLTENIIQILIKKAKFLAINAQINSGNFGYNMITKYNRGTYYCLDLNEARMAINSKYEKVERIPQILAEKTNGKYIAVTLGKDGSISCNPSGKICYSPALGEEIFDTMSSGDAYYSLSAAVILLSNSIQLSALVGNLAAAIKISIPRLNDSIDKDVFLEKLRLHLKDQ